MEQQSISIAKAGMVCSLPARTSLIAAANPVGGHYNAGKNISENLKMTDALLSRFDLCFVLLDRPNVRKDARLSRHVLGAMSGVRGLKGQGQPCRGWGGRVRGSSSIKGAQRYDEDYDYPGDENEDEVGGKGKGKGTAGGSGASGNSKVRVQARTTLIQRLSKTQPRKDLLPPRVLRRYLAYAKKFCHPRLSPAANRRLRNHYLAMRRQRQSQGRSFCFALFCRGRGLRTLCVDMSADANNRARLVAAYYHEAARIPHQAGSS